MRWKSKAQLDVDQRNVF